MKRLAVLSTALAIGLSGCVRIESEEDLYGRWRSHDNEIERSIYLERDGHFEVIAFPALLACAGPAQSENVDGEGSWRYDSADGRIILAFQKLSDPKCEVPYGTQVFAGPGDVIRAEPDVDRPSTRIDFEREGNTTR